MQTLKRHELRQQQRDQQRKTTTYNFNPEQIKQMVRSQIDKEIFGLRKEAAVDFTAALCLVMHDKYGWRKKRLTRFLMQLQTQYECIKQGYVTQDEIVKEVEKMGVKII